jgi:hypothetical protein
MPFKGTYFATRGQYLSLLVRGEFGCNKRQWLKLSVRDCMFKKTLLYRLWADGRI